MFFRVFATSVKDTVSALKPKPPFSVRFVSFCLFASVCFSVHPEDGVVVSAAGAPDGVSPPEVRFQDTASGVASCGFSVSEFDGDGAPKYYGTAVIEAAASNLALFSFNRWVTKKIYAQVNFEDIRRNFTSKWVWDNDTFSVNQLGHPYQGAFYFQAGRANNLNFYESGLLAVLGSVSWELLCENETPSVNDLIVSPTGGMVWGEILHRFWNIADAADFPLAFVFDPFASINTRLLGRPIRRSNGSIYSMSVSAGAGALFHGVSFSSVRDDIRDTPLATGNAGLRLQYGYPYGREVRAPFDVFAMEGFFAFSVGYYSAALFAEGLLYSVAPKITPTVKNTAGIAMRLDIVFDSNVDFSSHSLGVVFKEERVFRGRTELRWHGGADFVFFGASDYYFLRDGTYPDPVGIEERRNYSIGLGGALRGGVEVSHGAFGSFLFDFAGFALNIIDAAVPEYGSAGAEFILFLRASYERRVFMENLSAGVSAVCYLKQDFFDDAPDVFDTAESVSLFMRWKII